MLKVESEWGEVTGSEGEMTSVVEVDCARWRGQKGRVQRRQVCRKRVVGEKSGGFVSLQR